MSTVHLATSEAESNAVAALTEQFTELAGSLSVLVETLVLAVEQSDAVGSSEATTRLVTWANAQLVPFTSVRASTLYPAAHRVEGTRALIEALLGDHRSIADLVAGISAAANPVRAASKASSLETAWSTYALKETEQLLPALAQASGVSLADLQSSMTELAPAPAKASDVTAAEAPAKTGGCGCGGHDEPGLPVLDANAIPHAIRHATIFGALDAVEPGKGLVLVANHNPIPLLNQLQDRWPGRFDVEYLEDGPESWSLAFTR